MRWIAWKIEIEGKRHREGQKRERERERERVWGKRERMEWNDNEVNRYGFWGRFLRYCECHEMIDFKKISFKLFKRLSRRMHQTVKVNMFRPLDSIQWSNITLVSYYFGQIILESNSKHWFIVKCPRPQITENIMYIVATYCY